MKALFLVLALGGAFLGSCPAGARAQASRPAGGLPARALILGPSGGLVRAQIKGWKMGEGPILAPASPGKALPSGKAAWISSLGKGPGKPAPPPSRAVLFQGGELAGKLLGGDPQGETFLFGDTPFGSLRIPLPWLRGLLFPSRIRGWRAGELLSRAGPGKEILLVPARRGFDEIPGFLFRFAPGAIHFAPGQERDARVFPLEKVAALVRGRDPDEPLPPLGKDFRARLDLPYGAYLMTSPLGVKEGKLLLRLPWGQEASCPWKDVEGLALPGKDRLFLSFSKPLRVEETPYLGPGHPFLFPWKRNLSCLGTPLRAGGKRWPLGLGVHSRCRLFFALDGKWKFFFSLAAVDDSALKLPVPGDAAVRVYLDGKIIWEKKSLKGGEGPVAVGPLDVSGGKELALEVDFGNSLHLGDRVDWILPVLFR